MLRHLEVLGVELQVACDRPPLVEPFFAVFAHFETTGGGGRGEPVRVTINDASGVYEDGRRAVPLAPGRLRRPHVHNLLYTTLVRSLPGVFLLHAAAVEKHGLAWIVSAPSGSGKTSLARALVRRGYGFLGDDLAPLGIEDGLLHPFPRRLGLDRENAARLGQLDDVVVVGDKLFLAPESLGAQAVQVPLPLGAVVIMNPYQVADDDPIRLTVGLLAGGTRLLPRLEGIAGSALQRLGGDRDCLVVEAQLRGAAAVEAAAAALEEIEDEVLFHSRSYAPVKAYAPEPLLEPLPAREAAFGLMREMLNREPQSALMQRHQGRIAGVLFELLGILAQVPCHRLVPGPLEDTADLLAATFSA